MPAPIVTRWDGEAFRPLGRSARECDAALVVGRNYRLEILDERSAKSHNHQFAWLTEAWRNLPEDLLDIYPTEEHLRKKALIQAGFYRETILDVGSKAGALRVAADYRARDEFLLVIVRGSIIVIWEAKSQKRGAMLAKEFQASKTAIMAVIADLIGVEPEQLEREAGRAA